MREAEENSFIGHESNTVHLNRLLYHVQTKPIHTIDFELKYHIEIWWVCTSTSRRWHSTASASKDHNTNFHHRENPNSYKCNTICYRK